LIWMEAAYEQGAFPSRAHRIGKGVELRYECSCYENNN
jgi:hypothetical protein